MSKTKSESTVEALPTSPIVGLSPGESPPGLDAWIARLLADDEMLTMGHHQRRADLNLGMGWLYYGLARLVRPKQVVVIGSWRGFVPMIFGKALADNAEGGIVTFIDPSLVDDTWTHPENVQKRFHHFDVENVVHHKATTQEFVETEEYRSLGELGMVFIDGNHTEEQARFDYEAFADRVPPDGMILLHDSVRMEESSIYGQDQTYRRTVKLFVDELKQDPTLQVFDIPFQDGLTLVRHLDRKTEPPQPID